MKIYRIILLVTTLTIASILLTGCPPPPKEVVTVPKDVLKTTDFGLYKGDNATKVFTFDQAKHEVYYDTKTNTSRMSTFDGSSYYELVFDKELSGKTKKGDVISGKLTVAGDAASEIASGSYKFYVGSKDNGNSFWLWNQSNTFSVLVYNPYN